MGGAEVFDVEKGVGLRAQGRGLRAQGRGLRAQGRGLRAQGRGLRARGGGRRAQGRVSRAQGGGSRARGEGIGVREARNRVGEGGWPGGRSGPDLVSEQAGQGRRPAVGGLQGQGGGQGPQAIPERTQAGQENGATPDAQGAEFLQSAFFEGGEPGGPKAFPLGDAEQGETMAAAGQGFEEVIGPGADGGGDVGGEEEDVHGVRA